MSETPVPETLETIAAKIDALAKSNDQRFATVDQQLAETRAHLGVKIEALDTKVVQIYDACRVIAVMDPPLRDIESIERIHPEFRRMSAIAHPSQAPLGAMRVLDGTHLCGA
jgi:hypothetical protein